MIVEDTTIRSLPTRIFQPRRSPNTYVATRRETLLERSNGQVHHQSFANPHFFFDSLWSVAARRQPLCPDNNDQSYFKTKLSIGQALFLILKVNEGSQKQSHCDWANDDDFQEFSHDQSRFAALLTGLIVPRKHHERMRYKFH